MHCLSMVQRSVLQRRGTTALHYAAQAGHSRVVRALLKKGAEVNAVEIVQIYLHRCTSP